MKKVILPGFYLSDLLYGNRLFKLLGGKNLQQFCLHRIILKHVTVNVLVAMQHLCTVFVVFFWRSASFSSLFLISPLRTTLRPFH